MSRIQKTVNRFKKNNSKQQGLQIQMNEIAKKLETLTSRVAALEIQPTVTRRGHVIPDVYDVIRTQDIERTQNAVRYESQNSNTANTENGSEVLQAEGTNNIHNGISKTPTKFNERCL